MGDWVLEQQNVDPLAESEITDALAQAKFISGDIDWNGKPNNSAFLVATSILLDADGATIPGLTVELHYRLGRIARDCKYQFTIFLLRNGKKRRLYQIAVYPPYKSSHTGPDGKHYGPHQHFGERFADIDADVSHLGCENHEEWFLFFLSRANIHFSGKYYPPIQPDFFS